MLWQGLVYGATMGRSMRFPTLPPSATPDDISKTALESNLMWFPDNNVPPHGTLKPASWHSFWFNSGFLGGGAGRYAWCKPGTGSGKACQKNEDCKKININEVCGGDKTCRVDCSDIAAEKRRKSMLKVQHGPDAVGLSGTQKSDTNDLLIGIATRENCVDSQGNPLDCVIEATDSEGNVKHSFPAATQGRRRIIRAMVADLNQASANKKGTEVLEHQLRVQVDDIPKGIKTVGFRWARMSGQRLTWCDSNNPKSCPFVFPEQGVLDVHNGSFSITKSIAVPSLHYFEFLY
jgi:hypothetical protein